MNYMLLLFAGGVVNSCSDEESLHHCRSTRHGRRVAVRVANWAIHPALILCVVTLNIFTQIRIQAAVARPRVGFRTKKIQIAIYKYNIAIVIGWRCWICSGIRELRTTCWTCSIFYPWSAFRICIHTYIHTNKNDCVYVWNQKTTAVCVHAWSTYIAIYHLHWERDAGSTSKKINMAAEYINSPSKHLRPFIFAICI